MNLTGRQLVERKIITGPIYDCNVQPHSVDLNVVEIWELCGKIGGITDSTTLSERLKLVPYNMSSIKDPEDVQFKGWSLLPGVYELVFQQGCFVPADQRLRVIHRSSMVRNGGTIVSGIFDAGFKTVNIGGMLFLNRPLVIGESARIATIYAEASNQVEELYNGQFQGDKQRNS